MKFLYFMDMMKDFVLEYKKIFLLLVFALGFKAGGFVYALTAPTFSEVILPKKQGFANSPTAPAATKNEYVWEGSKIGDDGKAIQLKFTCEWQEGNSQRKWNIILTGLRLPSNAKNPSPVFKMRTNVPPSGKGGEEFVYAGEYLSSSRGFRLSPSHTERFVRELEVALAQSFKNHEQASQEYNEKIKYCENLKPSAREPCYSSSSGYQPLSPRVLLWVYPQMGVKPLGAIFDSKSFKGLRKFSC